MSTFGMEKLYTNLFLNLLIQKKLLYHDVQID